MPLHTKRVYDPPSPEDGFRVLVMRYWPRGIAKSCFDDWQRALAPSAALLSDYRSGLVSWGEYTERYHQEMAAPGAQEALGVIAERARSGVVTLLCWCADETRCHRTLLRDLVAAGGELVEGPA